MRIEWTPSLSVGIDEIDRHQRDLCAAAERLVGAAGARDGELEALVRRLLEIARAQFAAEERCLRDADAPALVRHAHEHRRFLDDLGAIADQLARGERAAVDRLDVARFVGTWIASHVKHSDRDVERAARTAAGRAGAFPSKRADA
jgi:hemerythrin-like metal-binding protein